MAARRRCLFKVIVLGDSGVGKTSLLNQHLTFCNLCPTLLETLSLGFVTNFMTKELQVDDRLVTLQIWDTAGQERFQSLGVAFYRGADCCVLVYDVNMLKSFEDLDNWYLEFLNQASPADPDHFPFFLVGNKIDVDGGNSRVVSERKASQWCASKGIMHYFETSAKEDLNIDATFLAIAKNSVKNHSEVAQSIYISGVEAAPEAEQPRDFCGC